MSAVRYVSTIVELVILRLTICGRKKSMKFVDRGISAGRMHRSFVAKNAPQDDNRKTPRT